MVSNVMVFKPVSEVNLKKVVENGILLIFQGRS